MVASSGEVLDGVEGIGLGVHVHDLDVAWGAEGDCCEVAAFYRGG